MTDQTIVRLKKIRGQVDGIIKMYEDCRECNDVVTQIVAARSALGSVGKMILQDEASVCSRDNNHDKLDKIIKQLFDIT